MRALWVGVAGVIFSCATLFAAKPHLSARIDPNLSVELSRDYEIVIVAMPKAGDAWTRLSLRLTGDATNWKRLAELNEQGENLMSGRGVRVPLSFARPSLQVTALRALFPKDRVTPDGWRHEVVASGAEGEPLWKIAEWFTGEGAKYRALRETNRGLALSTRAGDRVLISRDLLAPTLVAALPPLSVEPGVAAEREETTDREEPVRVAASRVPESRVTPPVVAAVNSQAFSTPPQLEYVKVEGRDYGLYRLQRGEALYSSVVVRFTGRVYAKDVNEAVERIVEENEIADVSKLHVDAPILIPLDLLTPEFLPTTNARRAEWEKSKEAARTTKRVGAKDLKGVWVVLDPGHGGRDVGTSHEDVWESLYVYDVVCRLKKILEKKSGAKVFVTTASKTKRFEVPESDVLRPRTDHVVLTTPEYELDDAVVGVNLRWYLANSIFRQAIDKSLDEKKVVFLSIHADSLHPSLRGAMAYIPGAPYVKGSFGKKGKVYLARAEVRESPTVTQTKEDAAEAEALSRGLAEAIIAAMSEAKLPVHPYLPVRDNVVRNGKEWVPAVIRYNKVPTRMLLEICNLGNAEDRELIQSRRYRQKLATAIYDGLVAYYGAADERGVEPASLAAAK